MTKSKQLALVFLLIFLAAMSRLVIHPFNFTPIIAMSIFAGFYINKKYFVIVPLLAMFVSDFFIGFYDFKLMFPVYLSIAIAFFIAHVMRNNKKWYVIFGTSVSSSIIFFILTNLAVWYFSGWYLQNFIGLQECFVAAIPFFRNSLVGDLFYSFLFFGAYEIVLILSFNFSKRVNFKNQIS